MKHNFQQSLNAVLKHEGGWADHPKDPGGATMRGVTLATFRRFVMPKATKADLRKITPEQLAFVYRRHYWDVVIGDQLPSGVDYALFDFAVNSGPNRAVKFIQKVVGVEADGRIGPVTLSAIVERRSIEVISQLCDNRLAWLKRLKTFRTFGKGWTRRVNGVKAMALELADDGNDSLPEVPTITLSNLTYVNQNATRNRPVTKALERMISESVLAVYGPKYRVEIYSGGQPKKGTSSKRTGSIRHDDYGKGGRAADVYVYDEANNRITGLEIARLAQYWLAKKQGCTGIEMRGGGIHLDEWTKPPKGGGYYWTYKYSDNQPYGAEIRKALEQGQKGILPELYKAPPELKPTTTSKVPPVAAGGVLAAVAVVIAELFGIDLTPFITN